MPSYQLTLHKTYYDKGFFNLGVDVDKFVRKTTGPISLLLGDSKQRVDASVNREANLNGTPRIMGGVTLRNWIQKTYQPGDHVMVDINSADELWIH